MISIIIPVYNNLEKLSILLGSIKHAMEAVPETEVMVVDDCSSEDLASLVKNDFGFVRIERLPRRSGPAAARNRGAEIAGGYILLFLDSDVIVKADTLEKVRDAFMNNRDMVALEGEYDAVPANKGFFPRYKALEYRSFVGDQEYLTIFGPRIGAIKRAVFLELGGFNQSYSTASVEDYEFSHRLHDKGYRIHYDKTLEVGHHFTEKLTKQFSISFHRAKAWAQLFLKKRKFDNFGTTLPEGMGRLAGFIFTISLLFIPVFKHFFVLSIALFIMYIILNKRFFGLVLREEGAYFLIRAVIAHLIVSFFITAGFVWGTITSMLKRGF